ncbi:hypothetical protein H6F86_03995 [Phormidium sp. FACHB-592]|uniref:Tetratricopeptide repeat protein n=1 Tax=Stenomitos frigidus AS-A4 TaxID=2933935 RepID=A0ABV0KUE6_9CYAN|nr:tetratricopeptide repeat protein [Phormidium sp. FACHB-592]MBD2073061.1 hypothetical protein [Phormidium sp. FACHB-592]
MTIFQPTATAVAVTPALAAHPEPQLLTQRTASYVPTESYRTWYQRGLFLLETKHPERALGCFDQALRLDAAQPDVWYTRGEVLRPMPPLTKPPVANRNYSGSGG